jgi:hypothetical protein
MNDDASGLLSFLDESMLLRVLLWFMLFAAVAWIGYVARRTFGPPPPEEPSAPDDEPK